jgi:sulfur carrier protein ThiS
VAVLLRVYAHALDDQEGLSKRRIAAALEQEIVPRSVELRWRSS